MFSLVRFILFFFAATTLLFATSSSAAHHQEKKLRRGGQGQQQQHHDHRELSTSNRFDEVRDLVMSLEGDFEKFYDKDNQAAGTRVRKGMQELKNLAQQIRTEVQQLSNIPDP